MSHYCLVDQSFLQCSKGKIQNADYEFVTEYSDSLAQYGRVNFFIDNLVGFLNNNKYNNDEIDQKKIQQIDNDFIAGIINCENEDISENLKDHFIRIFKENLYTQIGEYELAFQNSLDIFEEYYCSLSLFNDLFIKKPNKLLIDYQSYGKIQMANITANFVFKCKGNIYIFQSPNLYQNIVGFKINNLTKYEKIQQKQFKQLTDNCFLLDKSQAYAISDLILSDTFNYWDQIIQDDLINHFPRNVFYENLKYIYFLKITNIQ